MRAAEYIADAVAAGQWVEYVGSDSTGQLRDIAGRARCDRSHSRRRPLSQCRYTEAAPTGPFFAKRKQSRC